MTAENFENHTIFDRLSSLEEILSSDDTKSKVEIEKLSFFQTVLSYVKQRIDLTIPELLQQPELDALSNELNTGNSQINTFLGSNNQGYLNNATSNFNAALNRIKGFPIPISNKNFNFSTKIAEFERIITNKYNTLTELNQKLKSQIAEFGENLKDKETEIQRLLKLIESKDTEIENLNSTFQTGFNNIKSSYNQSFENDRNTFRTEFNAAKDEYQNEINSLKDEIDTNSDKLIENLKNKLEEAKKIVNIIGNVGVTGNYQNIANDHRKSANFWRWVAIGFMTILSGLLVYTLFEISSNEYNWKISLLRIIAAAALTYPATYASKESSKHRKLENINRTAELELSSIDAFIEMLDTNKKQEIKAKLAEKYFGNDKSNILNEMANEEISVSSFEKIIGAISKFINVK